MANMTGSSTAEIDAPRDRVWALVEDVESAPQWQGGLKSMHALERDGDGRAIFCETETDAKVRSVKAKVRFTYDGPGRLSWTQEQGDLKSVQGSWELEDLGGDRTRATYSIDVDLGLVPRDPPERLYHGTVERFLSSILKDGLVRGKRNHVHLSKDMETATKVGARRGKPVILKVEAGRMRRDGHEIYLSANGVWLTDSVPPGYLTKT